MIVALNSLNTSSILRFRKHVSDLINLICANNAMPLQRVHVFGRLGNASGDNHFFILFFKLRQLFFKECLRWTFYCARIKNDEFSILFRLR